MSSLVYLFALAELVGIQFELAPHYYSVFAIVVPAGGGGGAAADGGGGGVGADGEDGEKELAACWRRHPLGHH